jgi:signal transduction histidine kinase
MWKTISKGNIWRAEVKNKRKDGTFYWVDTFIIPLRNIDNEIVEYLSIRNNITDKKENEINIQDALRKAEESDKLKSAFLANISHEIRTPMNGIMGITELLERPNLTEQKKAEFLRLMYERSHHLLSVVNNILDISKLEARQVTPVHVVGNINEVFERLILTFGGENHLVKRKEITLRVVNRLTPRQNVIMADFIRLYQILHNLIANAIKFTVEGEVEFGCMLQNPEQLLFWVKDTGIGIQEHNIDNIFKPFQQASESTHEEFGGSGLGLAISKGLVEMWGGRIWVESKVGRGSVFYFTMPFLEVNTKNE